MKVIIRDMQTGVVKEIVLGTSVQKRVMKRAVAFYNNAKKLGIHGILFSYYLKYSWSLEKGHVWA